MPRITREYGLLVKDQDILDLVWPLTLSELYLLGERVITIQDAIETADILTIDKVAKETSDFQFRRLVTAVRRGVIDGDYYHAGFTTRILLAEVFSKTPDYAKAFHRFFDDLRAWRIETTTSATD